MTADDPGPRFANTAAPEGVRCSDVERERTAHALLKAAGEGRLSLAEVDERTATTYAAQYRHELGAVVADLPRAEAPAAGWRPVLAVAGRQLAMDLMTLTGRHGAASNPRRKAVLIVLMVLVFVAMGILAAHGFIDGGPEHHAVGHD
ncbi:DUF1707 SHOCT-like domain-containing protein [Amycolatopsis sp. H20-H5]|uniref:DUF1707 SHOCT-like domain-containing protein n=1 Tax=Amycolatopsis sp. H20-H5 TaxID=3046309 RepID=UPI002DBDE030|nr:DUF1707 domain-containing protein [Amycolatopsis sp. H20-H5]MEC3977443.1 DUF1707 domain-containing protein [Amycolatopsis sp. H20-H5]